MKLWLFIIIMISLALLALLKAHEVSSLNPYFRAERSVRLEVFENAKRKAETKDVDLIELWESILTGRSGPISKMMKTNYRTLGLNHIFTPSGFHLSAVLLPIMKIIKNHKAQLFFLLLIGGGLLNLPGFGALKRMVLIKGAQNLAGLHSGFVCAMMIDLLFGTFQESSLSFTYSFLFIGIIYTGIKGIKLLIWFFMAQIILAYFQGNDVSILILLFSPVLNFFFSLLMPVLFILSYPLAGWQLETGIFLLRQVQKLVDICAGITLSFPTMEVNICLIILMALIVFNKWRAFSLMLIMFCSNLNLDRTKIPGASKYEFVPQGRIVKALHKNEYSTVYYKDGRCRVKLVKGIWWKNCSPFKRSSDFFRF